jgi:thioredoxin 1
MTHIQTPDATQLQTLIDDPARAVLVYLSAAWCGPCKGMAPSLDAFALANTEHLVVAKIDIEQYPEVSTRFMVRSVPTMVLLEDGDVKGVHVGALTRAGLDKFLATSV